MTSNSDLHYRYNFGYLLGILLISVVLLLTVKWGSIPDLVKFISFGLTLTSLFLALIAIIYSMLSNTNFSQHIGTLQAASSEIRVATSELTGITTALDKKIAIVPKALKKVEDRVEKSHQEILDKLSYGTASKHEVLEQEENVTDDFVERFLVLAALNGLQTLYICFLAAEKGMAFNINKLLADSPFLKKDYFWGFMSGSSSAGILDYTQKDDMWTVNSLHKGISDMKEKCETRAKKIFEKDEDSKFLKNSLDYHKKIEEYFES